MKKIILIGGGGHCTSAIDVIEQEGKYKIAGIIDKKNLLGSKVLGYPVIGTDIDINRLAKNYQNALITLGFIKNPTLRIKLFNLVKKAGFKLPSIVSPRAYISRHSKIGVGTILMHNVIVNANSVIGDNCIINSKALIEHDCLISSHSHISTNVVINGGVKVGAKCFIGSSVTSKNNIEIKKNSFVKAGSIVK